MLSKCCCCVPLRAGSIVLGILGILAGIAQFFIIQGQPWANIVAGIFYLIAYGALVFGAIKYNAIAVMVNLVCTAIIIVVAIIASIMISAAIGSLNLHSNQQSFLAWAVVANILGALLNAYFWVCTYSFYKEMKEGNENPV